MNWERVGTMKHTGGRGLGATPRLIEATTIAANGMMALIDATVRRDSLSTSGTAQRPEDRYLRVLEAAVNEDVTDVFGGR